MRYWLQTEVFEPTNEHLNNPLDVIMRLYSSRRECLYSPDRKTWMASIEKGGNSDYYSSYSVCSNTANERKRAKNSFVKRWRRKREEKMSRIVNKRKKERKRKTIFKCQSWQRLFCQWNLLFFCCCLKKTRWKRTCGRPTDRATDGDEQEKERRRQRRSNRKEEFLFSLSLLLSFFNTSALFFSSIRSYWGFFWFVRQAFYHHKPFTSAQRWRTEERT